MLLVASGLLMRSFFKLLDIDPGFNATNVLTAGLPINQEQHPDPVELNAYLASISAAVEAVPGVRETAMTSALPLQGWGYGVPYSIADRELTDPANRRPAFFKIVSPSYFDALGIKLLAGRVLSDNDRAGAPPVALINETLAKREFPDEDPIGRRILVREIVPGKTEFGQEIAWEIVGVIAGEKITGLGDAISAGMYVSNQQSPTYGINLIVRAGMPPQSLQRAVRSAVDRVNRDQALSDVRTLEQIVDQSMLANRVTSTLLTAFASIALLLAAVGIYGVISYTAAQRTHEMGIRAALGASAGNLRTLIFLGGMRLTVIGLLIGLAGTISATDVLSSMLYGVGTYDPLTIAVVAAVLSGGRRAGVFLASLADHESRSDGSAAVSMRAWLAPSEHGANHEILSTIYRSAQFRPCRVRVCLGRPSEARNTSRSPPRSEPATRSVPWVGQVVVIQPAGGAGRVRVIQSAGLVRVIESARRSLHLARECSASREHGNSSRNNKQSSHLSVSLPSLFDQHEINGRFETSEPCRREHNAVCQTDHLKLRSKAAPNHHSNNGARNYKTVWGDEQAVSSVLAPSVRQFARATEFSRSRIPGGG